MAAAACSLPAARPHASYLHSRGPLLTTLVLGDALHRLRMADELAVDAAANIFIGAAAAVPAVPAAQRGAAAQAHGAYRQHACRMRSHALMSMCAAAAGMSHAAHLAARPHVKTLGLSFVREFPRRGGGFWKPCGDFV